MAAIEVQNLGKQYRIGRLQERHDTLRDALADMARTPARWLRVGRGEDRQPETIWALRNVSFDVQRGEVVGIIGRNGAGKSTLLKVLSRITEPTEGRARIRGRVGSLLEVGTGFHQELTGRENVYLNGAILGMRRAEIDRKFDEIVAFSGVEKFIDTPVKRYSSGMYLRLAFAVAAHLELEILLVDEVLAVGDAEFQKKCLGKMGDIAGEGRTVLLVSHNMAAVQALCRRVICVDAGQIAFDGETINGITHYLSSQSQRNAAIPVKDRQDRQGTPGPFRFESICFRETASGQVLGTVLSGQNISIDIGYTNKSDRPLGPVYVAIGFFSETGQFMFACNNEAVSPEINSMGDTGTITFTIERWPLTAGLYSYNLHSRQGNVVTDWIKDAGQIRVETGDYYGTGKMPTSHQGVLIDYRASLRVE